MNIEFESRLIEAYKSHLRENLISIVIFGSRARGDHTENSDFDILIIAAHLPERHLARMGYIRGPLFKFNEKVQVLAKTPDEFDSIFPPLYLDIALDGKILVDKDGKIRWIADYPTMRVPEEEILNSIKKSLETT